MSQIGEAIAQSNIADDKTKCPFCQDKNLDDCKAKKNDPVTKVVSKPSQLGCTPLTPKGDFAYTTAKHHLISAKQCYARLRRCVRMGSMAGYDINSPPNGIALPTVANNLRFTVGSAYKKKYGKLSPNEKKEVAFSIMRTEGAQWHVGHHAVTIEVCEYWAEEEEDTPWMRGHQTSYDNEVINQLLKILSKYDPPKPCNKTKPDKFISDMNHLSDVIKTRLNMFKSDNPSASEPYFVSKLAYRFANKHIVEENESL